MELFPWIADAAPPLSNKRATSHSFGPAETRLLQTGNGSGRFKLLKFYSTMKTNPISTECIGNESSDELGALAAAELATSHTDHVFAERDKRVRALWDQTPDAAQARIYLIERCGLTESTIKRYHIGLVSCRSSNRYIGIEQAVCVPIPDRRGPSCAPCLAAESPTAKRRGQYVLLTIPKCDSDTTETKRKRGLTLTTYLTAERGRKI